MQLATTNNKSDTLKDNYNSDKFIHKNKSYFMAIYNNKLGKWQIIRHKFLLTRTEENNQLIGEFISSLWFKDTIDTDMSTTVLILKDDEFFSREGFMAAFGKKNRMDELESILNANMQTNQSFGNQSFGNQSFINQYNMQDNLNDLVIDRFVLTYDEVFNFYKYAKSGEQYTITNISGENNYMNHFTITLCKDLNYIQASNIYGLYAYCPKFVINL